MALLTIVSTRSVCRCALEVVSVMSASTCATFARYTSLVSAMLVVTRLIFGSVSRTTFRATSAMSCPFGRDVTDRFQDRVDLALGFSGQLGKLLHQLGRCKRKDRQERFPGSGSQTRPPRCTTGDRWIGVLSYGVPHASATVIIDSRKPAMTIAGFRSWRSFTSSASAFSTFSW